MKKIILSAAVAAFALSMAPAFADSLPVKVTKTKIPEGCEYKKVAGKKKKQLVCIEEMKDNDGGVAGIESGTVDGGEKTPQYRGQSNNLVGANNGKGNGTNDGTPGKAPPKDVTP